MRRQSKQQPAPERLGLEELIYTGDLEMADMVRNEARRLGILQLSDVEHINGSRHITTWIPQVAKRKIWRTINVTRWQVTVEGQPLEKSRSYGLSIPEMIHTALRVDDMEVIGILAVINNKADVHIAQRLTTNARTAGMKMLRDIRFVHSNDLTLGTRALAAPAA
jgi:hypothetical protein